MKKVFFVSLLFVLQACSMYSKPSPVAADLACEGNTDLPSHLASQFDEVEDESLLKAALGEPDKGELCQGKVYRSKENAQVMIFRAWNSTNPNSQYGQWWAFNKPIGKIAKYRLDYEICYQWSPLDKMTSCTLKADTKVVVGNGQSAVCSDYLSYPVSEKQQVYIVDAKNAVENCNAYDGVMHWE